MVEKERQRFMSSNHTAFLIFAKRPETGKVKTRLGQSIGMDSAAKLYHEMTKTCVKRYRRIASADCILYYDPPEEKAFFEEEFGQVALCIPQPPGGLGERLAAGFKTCLKSYHNVIALGTDSPDLPLEHLEAAIQALAKHDVAIGPANDGGYYFIGMSRFLSQLFEDIDWSSGRELSQTLQKCDAMALRVFQAPIWRDIDEQADLEALLQSNDPDIVAMIENWRQSAM